jgi:hypothetical protein
MTHPSRKSSKTARRVMLALPESSNTNPRGHRPGHEGSSFSVCTRPAPGDSARRFPGMRYRAAPLALLILLTGCFTGERPSFTTEPFQPGSSSGDPAIDSVLEQLDATNDGPFTADYTVLTKFGNTTRPATVAVSPSRRSVTVGDVRFITIDGTSQTCILDKSDPCSTSIDPARISDTQVTPDFYASDAAKRLRRSATARIGTPIAHTEQFAGQSATCVDVPVSGGVSVYCVLPKGPLAELDDGAVSINLTQYATAVDEAVFSPTTAP